MKIFNYIEPQNFADHKLKKYILWYKNENNYSLICLSDLQTHKKAQPEMVDKASPNEY